MEFMDVVKERARAKHPTLVFAEGDDASVIEAAKRCQQEGIAECILVANSADTLERDDLAELKVIDLSAQDAKKQEYAELYEKLEDFPAEAIRPMMDDPLSFACMVTKSGEADGMVAGYIYSTPDVITQSQLLIGLAPGTVTASSYVIEDVPDWDGGEDGLIAFGDCSMVPQPNAEELAAIAINTADSLSKLLGWTPRIGLVSFSTTGSASHADADKVKEALRIAREKRPDLLIDGELQVDAAVKPATSLKKVKGENNLKGNANILIFPDLDAGNSACKLVQIFGKANMYGAIMCGFAKPLADLSRNMSVEDIVGGAAIVAASV